jgi:hypothetical protein
MFSAVARMTTTDDTDAAADDEPIPTDELDLGDLLTSARAHLARARECGDLDDDTRLSLFARGVRLGAIQGQHVAMAQAAAAVAIAGELGAIRKAIEVLAGGELDRRAEQIAGPVLFDQGDEPTRPVPIVAGAVPDSARWRVDDLEAAIAEALDELGEPGPEYPAPVANAVAILRAVER